MPQYAQAFRIAFPDQADWPSVLRRLPDIKAEEVRRAVQAALDSWYDTEPMELDFDDDDARQFVMEQVALFAEEVEPHEGAGTSFAAVPENYQGSRSELRTATVVLDALGLLNQAGYQLQFK